MQMSDETPWAARYNTWLLITLTPKGVVSCVLFLRRVVFVEKRLGSLVQYLASHYIDAERFSLFVLLV